ncbi:MAG TPA: hypothetical protein VFI22_02420, partial [Thermomicrobiales bacterium]|nr:hypothetical protein [Thermomicrobiales bacterium]
MIRHHDDVIRLANDVRAGRLSRRDFLARAMAAGFSLTMASAFLAPGRAVAAPARSLARQDQPKQGGQVIVGFSQEPTIFNPLKSTLEVDRGVQFSLFDSLWR